MRKLGLNIVPFPDKIKEPKTLIWLTDLHLDATEEAVFQSLLDTLKELDPDLILVGGDTCNGHKALKYLSTISEIAQKPVHFVLGNHEFYHGSIIHIRKLVQHAAQTNRNLHYLTHENSIELTPTTALIGHDGWSDARAGDFLNSTVSLHDYTLIEELKGLDKISLREKLYQLGTEASHDIQKKLKEVFQTYSNVIILTHTPPFQAACLYEKRISDDNWAPHFVCKAMGDMLANIMNANPSKQAIVLCGHAHQLADIAILPNLRVIVGESTLGSPQIQGLITV